jgi:pimeloyl-ACP methyl ester carboxylesterase
VARDAWLLLGDLASLADDLDRANGCYDRALALAADEAERRLISNKVHRPGHASRDGARLAFYEHGSGEPAIVFVNPIVYGLATFQPLLERLCQEFRVITVDCRGAGRSAPLARPYSIAEHAKTCGRSSRRPARRRWWASASRAAPTSCCAWRTGIRGSWASWCSWDADGRRRVGCRELLPSGIRAAPGRGLRARGRGRAHPAAAEFVYTEEHAGEELRRIFIERCRACPGNRPQLLRPRSRHEHRADPGLHRGADPGRAREGGPAQRLRRRRVHRRPHPRVAALRFEGKGHNPMFSATEEFCEVLRRFVRNGEVTGAPAQGGVLGDAALP